MTTTRRRSSRRRSERDGEREALFVRIPADDAARLDRAAFELKASKGDLVAGLVARYVDPSTPEGLAALSALGEPAGDARRVTIETGGEGMTVGHHSFRADPPAEVLTLAQAAELLQADEDAVAELAERGELPTRRIGEQWRFARRAIVDWLAAGAS